MLSNVGCVISLQKKYVQVLTPGTEEVKLFRNKIFANEIKKSQHEAILDIERALNPLAGVTIREARGIFETKAHRHREGDHVRMGADIRMMYL